ncbi:hypothetical protein WJX84_012447 [Apatococcus fuscideae]|uniref:Uncharacterized protein n=1 Tax=Apatococcus fuscideae TaxID=2026836 RepID=A0AAW1SMF6_9CHLO
MLYRRDCSNPWRARLGDLGRSGPTSDNQLVTAPGAETPARKGLAYPPLESGRAEEFVGSFLGLPHRQFIPDWSAATAAAMPADDNHRALVFASRHWRKGVRTFIANNNPVDPEQVEAGKEFNETWSYYPDDVPLRSLYGGDSRAALVPFLAHTQLQDTYKWLLYGDDDTVWFLEGVMSMLEDLDPDMPYFITDHMWWSNTPGRASHPNRQAPRCLPCNFDKSKFKGLRPPFEAPIGCPCTPQSICEADDRGIFNQYCDIPRAPIATYSMHGGAGGIMSIGMMRAVSLDFMEKCIRSLYSTGGDAFLSICLWQAGYGITDPGYSFYHPEVQMFDPGPEDRMGVMMRLVRALDHRCDETCQHQLDFMMTMHVRSRVFPLLSDAAQFIKAVSGLYDVYIDTKRTHALQAIANAGEMARAAAVAAKAASDSAKEQARVQKEMEELRADASNQNAAAVEEAEVAAKEATADASQKQRRASVQQDAAEAANKEITVAQTTAGVVTGRDDLVDNARRLAA